MKILKASYFILLLFIANQLNAQFHSLTLPLLSPKASVSQQVGATFIQIEYNSPSTRGRDVWNNPNVIPQNGKPFPWRAGAQTNTTIQFDTDVIIEGNSLPAGKYGFHILPNGHDHTLLFARPNNLWGSYYLDLEKDVALRVEVKDTTSQFQEHLSYHFNNRTDSSALVNLSWGDRTIPFTVSVDLNKTILKKLRVDLHGESTYQWEAWNDAAAWCLQRNTNLEEALTWADRSINGGLGGFAANKNLTNLGTKARILKALGKSKEANDTFREGFDENYGLQEAQEYAQMLLANKEDKIAIDFTKKALQNYKEDWVLTLFQSIGYYYQSNQKQALSTLKKSQKNCPDWFKPRAEQIQEQMENKTYELRGRN